MFLARTIENALENIEGDTEIIVALDGLWADPPIKDDPRVTILYVGKSIGQRAATNQACRLSDAKYVMKVDAHCAFDKGFDVKMMDAMEDHYTMVPIMYNLHAFDWVCQNCEYRTYQGPTPKLCEKCGGKMEREMIWRPRWNRKSTAYRFDKNMKFQYWGAYKERQREQGQLVDTLSLQGSCFMLTRKKYWELNICDEKHGGWGQQGTEVACKTWLSGGEVKVNLNTWYAHMFRTQGGDFGFPYPISGSDVSKAREYSKHLWLGNNWDKAKHDLNWLLEKFKPVPEWHGSATKKKPKKGVVYYTHNQGSEKLLQTVREQIKKGIKEKHIVSVSLKPLNFGKNIVIDADPGYLTMAKQIKAGLEASDADVIWFCEHDVLYHTSHFDFIPSRNDQVYYNTNVWRVRVSDGHALYCDNLQQLSGLVAFRDLLIEHYTKRIRLMEEFLSHHDSSEFGSYVRRMGFEPGTHNRTERVDDLVANSWQSKYPNIDLRHDSNLTPSRWSKEQFKNQRYTLGWTESTVDQLQGWSFTPKYPFLA